MPLQPLRLFTARLELISLTPDLAGVFLDARALSEVLAAEIPGDWPPDEMDDGAVAWLKREAANPAAHGWLLWFVLLREPRTLIGTSGFKGPPTPEGRADVGYSVVRSHQRRGYATEALSALVRRAFADPRVSHLVGETYPTIPESVRVLEKNWFRSVGVATGFAGEENVSRYELARADAPAAP